MDVGVSCSWRHPLPPCMLCSDESATRMCAERAASSCDKGGSATTFALVDEAGVAPWVAVQLRQRVKYIAVVSSARVIEVHIGGAPIRTHEGTITAGDWFLHCINCDALAEQTLKLKFFARKQKKTINIAAICLSTDDDAAMPVDADNATCVVSHNVAPTMEHRLQHLESAMQVLMGTMMRRLSDVEARLCVLEHRGVSD